MGDGLAAAEEEPEDRARVAESARAGAFSAPEARLAAPRTAGAGPGGGGEGRPPMI